MTAPTKTLKEKIEELANELYPDNDQGCERKEFGKGALAAVLELIKHLQSKMPRAGGASCLSDSRASGYRDAIKDLKAYASTLKGE